MFTWIIAFCKQFLTKSKLAAMEAMTLTEITAVPQIFRDFLFNGKENSKLKIHFLFATMGIQTPEKHERTV